VSVLALFAESGVFGLVVLPAFLAVVAVAPLVVLLQAASAIVRTAAAAIALQRVRSDGE
jgi:hypothetical protein